MALGKNLRQWHRKMAPEKRHTKNIAPRKNGAGKMAGKCDPRKMVKEKMPQKVVPGKKGHRK